MPKYIIRYQANPAAWPTDPAEVLAVWEGVNAGVTALLDDGTLSEVNWTSNSAGYAIMEAPSKAAVIAITAPFFPLFDQELDEAVPWAEGTAGILNAARAAAGQ